MPYYLDLKKKELDIYLKTIQKAVYQPVSDLEITAWITPEPVSYEQRESGKKISLKVGQKWGDLFDCGWFHFTGRIPGCAAGKKVVLLLDINGEMCVVDRQGHPLCGLTNGSSVYDYTLGQPGKKVLPITDAARENEIVDVWADAGCNDLFGTLCKDGTVELASIAICNEAMRGLYYDFEVLIDFLKILPENTARSHQILHALHQATLVLNNYTEAEAAQARQILAPVLSKKNGDPSLSISAVGHSHMDLAWLWPIRETIRKGARTFATVLQMMDRYPNYIFGASQPQLYQWMKDHYPSLYQRIREKVAQGRWEVQGGMWVEADTNVTGGEALIRQFLYGKRFFRREFGIDLKNLWLPDVFGYSGALPQIMKKCGVDYFMTQKLSWSETNRFPHHTFRWDGIDGTEVLTHMLPEETYNSPVLPWGLHKAETVFCDKGISDRCLLLFGIGDGGGGPGEEHLERCERVQNLAGLPPVIQEPAYKFFQRIDQDTHRYQKWTGELYLERHRGTYTTQARSKWFNRKMELALRELELNAALAQNLVHAQYPADQLDQIWKETLLYQFHDILPGSSIKRVYDESLARYASLHSEVLDLTNKAKTAVFTQINTAALQDPAVISNSLSWPREEWLKIGPQWTRVSADPLGYTTIDLARAVVLPHDLIAKKDVLENDILKVSFAPDGSIQSIFDKSAQREIIPSAASANRLAVYPDRGDAWDFSMDYADRQPDFFTLQSASAKVDGPRAILHQEYTHGQSRLTQDIILTHGSRRLDFVTHIDWQETHKMLRTSFPVDIHAREATCEIQFGSIKRPTHANTTWDLAKFEICAHKYLDISQPDYGVALLNDCKYGHKVLGNILDLDLLRSPDYPGKEADRGEHELTYCLFPHPGSHIEGKVMQAGYELNCPLQAAPLPKQTGSLPASFSLLTVDAPNVIVETVKKAQDSDSLIIRLYEAAGCSARANLHFAMDIKNIEQVDMMEENPIPLSVQGTHLPLSFRPFEIQTLKISV